MLCSSWPETFFIVMCWCILIYRFIYCSRPREEFAKIGETDPGTDAFDWNIVAVTKPNTQYSNLAEPINHWWNTVYPIKYAHAFVMLCISLPLYCWWFMWKYIHIFQLLVKLQEIQQFGKCAKCLGYTINSLKPRDAYNICLSKLCCQFF